MVNIVNEQELNEYKAAGTRSIVMPDNSQRIVRMTPDHWEVFDALKAIEGINETELAGYALEEAELQGITFDQAYRGCVAHIAKRWS